MILLTGGCLLLGGVWSGGVCLVRGGASSGGGGVSGPGGGGCMLRDGASSQGGVWSWGVVCSGVCVCLLWGVMLGGFLLLGGLLPGGGDPRPPRDGYCCERYASYWNAFLLQLQFNLFVLLCRDTLIPSSLPEANITRYDVRWTETGIDPAKSKGNINAFLFISQTKFMAICTVGQIIKLQPLDFKTRMHSSRMRTAHLLTVSRSIPCVSGGGRVCPWMQTPLDADPPGGIPPPPGCRPPWSCDL